MKRGMVLMASAAMLASCGEGAGERMTDVVLDTAMTAEQKTDRLLIPEVMWKMGRVVNSSLSADGTNILYALTHYNMADNKGYTALWVMPLNAPEQARQITDNNSGNNSPRWNTVDGIESVYFLSTRSGGSQLWSVGTDGTGLKQLSDIEGGITGFGISPDGNKIWYAADVKVKPSASAEIYPDMGQSKALIYDDLMERHWDCWEDGAYSHIFVAGFQPENGLTALEGAVDIMPNEPWDAPLAPDFEMAEIAWRPDGQALAYTCKKLEGYAYAMSTDSDIYLYTLAEKTTENLTQGMPGYDRNPVFSPDGTRMAWNSMARPMNEADKNRLMVMTLQSDDRKELTAGFDYNAENVRWAGNDLIYFIAPIEGTHQICSTVVDFSRPDPLEKRAEPQPSIITEGDHDYTAFSLAYTPDHNSVVVAEKTTLSTAAELFAINLTDGSDQPISRINAEIYAHVDMGIVQKRWVTTTDGKQMLTWVILPPGFDSTKQYPTLLYCQGGPQSVVSQRWSYRWNFQLMAAQGYVVVAPNRRGLPSFGQEWLDQISGDYAGQNIRDYLSAIDDVAQEPWVDKENMGCVGASYGGYSAFYLMGHHQKRFKAFIAHCGIYNLESFYAETEELWFPEHDYGGAPWEADRKPVAARTYANSPHKAANQWDTPILIVTGANDFRIPYTQSLQAFTAARAHGLEARLVFFENEAHQVFKPQNSLVWNREFFGWLDKYLK